MKGFFKNFTGGVYNFDTKDFKSKRIIVDITRNIQFKDINNIIRYDKYYIDDEEKADTIAYKLYGDATKHWIIYLLNPELKRGWPYNNRELEKLIESKYGQYSFLSLADEKLYSINFKNIDNIKFYMNQNENSLLDIDLHQLDYSRRAMIITKKPNDSEWMKNLETIYIRFFRNFDGVEYSDGSFIPLTINADNCRYHMKNAVHSYESKTYRDALLNNDGILNSISFEEYEINYNETKRFIRVLNRADAEIVSQQYFAILKDV